MPPTRRVMTFRLPPELIEAVDAARGDVPRTMFVQRALEAALDARPAETLAEPPAPLRAPASRAEAFRRSTQK